MVIFRSSDNGPSVQRCVLHWYRNLAFCVSYDAAVGVDAKCFLLHIVAFRTNELSLPRQTSDLPSYDTVGSRILQ